MKLHQSATSRGFDKTLNMATETLLPKKHRVQTYLLFPSEELSDIQVVGQGFKAIRQNSKRVLQTVLSQEHYARDCEVW